MSSTSLRAAVASLPSAARTAAKRASNARAAPAVRPCPLCQSSRQQGALLLAKAATLEAPTRPHQAIGQEQRYDGANASLQRLLASPDLDAELRCSGDAAKDAAILLQTVQDAKTAAYSSAGSEGANAAHLFLQRVLYSINRLNFFWFGDLAEYTNEGSPFLAQLRSSIETDWQQWEDREFQRRVEELYPASGLPDFPKEVKDELRRLGSIDVAPEQSSTMAYISNELTLAGYKHLLAIGVGNEISCMVFKVLMEEYGSGRLGKKHSTVFAKMMEELGLDSTPERYLDLAPWQLLRAINHNFLLTERRRYYLRYLGGLTFFELNGPSVYSTYLHAARRLGLSEAAASYWELHIREDERHGAQMMRDVALPLVDMYPTNAQEVLRGYLQEKWIGEEAGAAIVAACKAQEAAAGV